MKFDFSTKILDIKNDPIKDPSNGVELTLAIASSNALLAPYESERNLDGASKVRRFKLALRLVDGGEQELTAEEIVELKKVIAMLYPALIVGRAYAVLEAA